MAADWFGRPNVWLGTTVEREDFTHCIDTVRALPAAIVYRGILFPEFVELWVTEMDRQFAPPKTVPAATAKAAPSAPGPRHYLPHERQPTTDSARGLSLAFDDRTTQKQPRPVDDMSALQVGEARVRVMRPGYSPADDRPQRAFGEIIVMPHGAARRAAEMAAVEILEEMSQ